MKISTRDLRDFVMHAGTNCRPKRLERIALGKNHYVLKSVSISENYLSTYQTLRYRTDEPML